MTSEPAVIRVLSIDDHPLFRAGIAAIVNAQPDMQLAGIAASGLEAIEVFRTVRPDVTLLDLRLPDMSGIDVMTAIRSEFPDARIVFLTTFEGDVEIRRALVAGAKAYLLKSMPPKELLQTIRQVHAGRKYVPQQIANELAQYLGQESLSQREIEVLKHVAEGDRNRDIAKRLFIAEETVKAHLKHIMSKLGANDRTQSVAIAARRGIIAF